MRKLVTIIAITLNTFTTCFAFQKISEVKVDAISGKIELPSGGIPILYPNDKVNVTLENINLIHYAYKIMIGHEELKMEYPIVGAGDAFIAQRSNEQFIQDDSDNQSQLKFAKKDEWSNDFIIYLFEKIFALKTESNVLFRKVNATIAFIEDFDTEVNKSHKEYDSIISDFEVRFHEHLSQFQKLSKEIESLQYVYSRLELSIALGILNPPKEFDLSQLNLNTRLENLEKAQSISYEALVQTQKRVQRWDSILKAHPTAELSHSFTVERGNRRYTIQILRKPVSASAKSAVQTQLGQGIQPIKGGEEKNPEDDDYQVLASFTYEGHTKHRFNLSMGLAYLGKQDDRTFAVQATPNDADGLDYFLREASSEQHSLLPVAQLGMYIKPFDPFDPQDKICLMFNLGTEISTSPNYYFAGLSADTHWGITLGVGIFTYQQTQLAEGWKLGDKIMVDEMNMPIITEVPTQKSTEIGSYVHLSFRPSIFKKFWSTRAGK